MKAKYLKKPDAPRPKEKDPPWFSGPVWAIDTGTQFTVVATPDKETGGYSPLPEPVGVTREAFEARYQRMP